MKFEDVKRGQIVRIKAVRNHFGSTENLIGMLGVVLGTWTWTSVRPSAVEVHVPTALNDGSSLESGHFFTAKCLKVEK